MTEKLKKFWMRLTSQPQGQSGIQDDPEDYTASEWLKTGVRNQGHYAREDFLDGDIEPGK